MSRASKGKNNEGSSDEDDAELNFKGNRSPLKKNIKPKSKPKISDSDKKVEEK
jgi:hypothetical protein